MGLQDVDCRSGMARAMSREAILTDPLIGSASLFKASEMAGSNAPFTRSTEKAGGGGSSSSAEVESGYMLQECTQCLCYEMREYCNKKE